MSTHAMHRNQLSRNMQSSKKKRQADRQRRYQNPQNTPQDKKFFLNQILFANSAK